MDPRLPATGAGRLSTDFPAIWEAYQGLGKAAAESGPLAARELRLIKLALSIGAGSEGAVHAHVRQAAAEGLSPEEIRQVCILAITTLGFPAAMAALSWANDILK